MFQSHHVVFLSIQTVGISWINQTNLYFLPLYFQNLRGWSPLVSAAMLLPIVSIQSFVSALAGKWITKKGAYGGVIWLGSGLLLIGSCLQIILDAHTHPAAIIFILLVVGIGFGSASQPIIIAMLSHTKNDDRAVITSSRLFFRSIGAAVGVAISSTVLQTTFKAALPPKYKFLSGTLYSLAGLGEDDRQAVTPAYARSIRDVFITNAAVALVSGLCCLGWKDIGCDDTAEDSSGNARDETAAGSSGEAAVELSTLQESSQADGQHRSAEHSVATSHAQARPDVKVD